MKLIAHGCTVRLSAELFNAMHRAGLLQPNSDVLGDGTVIGTLIDEDAKPSTLNCGGNARGFGPSERPDSYYEGQDPNFGRAFTVERGTSGMFWWHAKCENDRHGPFLTAKDAWNNAREVL
jgi:hypothetical protein